MRTIKITGYSVGTALAGSLVVLLIGLVVFGFHPQQWSEWQGRVVGIVGTIVAITGAVIGFRIAMRAVHRAHR